MNRVAHNKITNLPEADIVKKYESGVSENKLSKEYLVSRKTIRRILRESGVHIRSQSEAELVKWSRMTSEQRANQVAKCHAAVLGFKKSEETKHEIAISRQRNTPDWYIGVGEKEFRNLLCLNSIDFEYQKPVLWYNLDFFINGVAVELTSFTGRNSRVKKPQQVRAFNIFNSDSIHTLAVEIETKNDIGLFYSQIMSAVFDLQKKDKSHCNYWIARCRGNSFSLEKIVIKNLQ